MPFSKVYRNTRHREDDLGLPTTPRPFRAFCSRGRAMGTVSLCLGPQLAAQHTTRTGTTILSSAGLMRSRILLKPLDLQPRAESRHTCDGNSSARQPGTSCDPDRVTVVQFWVPISTNCPGMKLPSFLWVVVTSSTWPLPEQGYR